MSESISRCEFIAAGGAALLGYTVLPDTVMAIPPQAMAGTLAKASLPAALCIYSHEGATTAGKALLAGASALDAVEQGIRAVEDVPLPGGYNVGLSAVVNEHGNAQLDATIMDGRTHRSGSVGALEGIAHPISVARKVLEETPHSLIVGKGAQDFAVRMGFKVEEIVSDISKQQYDD
ncbi:MAG: isoaspartyl peptidase/L-asparaginase [candidate division Zixibacteria bacterium]|nr:isoaspartyl peptidase/L-asparaginase [candidate division Zixibacteria bacterium]